MLFQTLTFFLFFCGFFALYYILRNRLTAQNTLVLLGSYLFYGAWDERFLALIIVSTATDYIAGIGASGKLPSRNDLLKTSLFISVGCLIAFSFTLADSWQYLVMVAVFITALFGATSVGNGMEHEIRRKFFVGLSVTVNLGLLATFKYFGFFADSLSDLLSFAGYEVSWVTLSIVLPVGISFYTFQTLSYSIDIYRKKIEPRHNFLQLAAFVAFFPQLVAGPVERAANLLPQFNKLRKIEWENIKTGATLFAWGLFKKVVIADNLAPIADAAFTNPATLSSGELLAGLLAFTFQIYCDFSGYSDMARGLARALGFNLMLNFNIPYISRTPSEFWERWHISLSSWLRDYLYIPLGGNRGGTFGTYRNLSLTMLLGGLWHGASWTFVIWGAFHGFILVCYRILNVDQRLAYVRTNFQSRSASAAIDVFAIAVMFLLTIYGWLIFRANEFDVLVTYTKRLLSLEGGWAIANFYEVVLYVIPLIAVQFIQLSKKSLEPYWDLPMFVRVNIGLFVLYSIVFLQPRVASAFIYFDF